MQSPCCTLSYSSLDTTTNKELWRKHSPMGKTALMGHGVQGSGPGVPLGHWKPWSQAEP